MYGWEACRFDYAHQSEQPPPPHLDPELVRTVEFVETLPPPKDTRSEEEAAEDEKKAKAAKRADRNQQTAQVSGSVTPCLTSTPN